GSSRRSPSQPAPAPPAPRASETMLIKPYRDPRSGSVLVAVLVIITLLSLAAYHYSELMTAEYRAADSSLRALQANAPPGSGVHHRAAALSDPTTFKSSLNSNPFDNQSMSSGIQVGDSTANRTGRFYIFSPADYETGSFGQNIRYGVIDESGKININA